MTRAVQRSRSGWAVMAAVGVAAAMASLVVPGGPPARAASVRPVDRLVRDLTAKGLRLDATERACVAGPASAAPTGSALDELLRCVTQEHAVAFVVARWKASGATTDEVTCLTGRLRLATWPEVSEAVRSAVSDTPGAFVPPAPAADVRASAPPAVAVAARTIFASRLGPYAASCTVSASARGSKLPTLSLAQFTGRWNAAVARQSSPFGPITKLDVQPPLPGSTTAPDVSTSATTVADATTLGINTNAAGVTGAYVGIHGALATPEATAAALALLSEVVEGRDRAPSLVRSVDVAKRFERFDQVSTYIGHASYTVKVDKAPRAVLVFVTW